MVKKAWLWREAFLLLPLVLHTLKHRSLLLSLVRSLIYLSLPYRRSFSLLLGVLEAEDEAPADCESDNNISVS